MKTRRKLLTAVLLTALCACVAFGLVGCVHTHVYVTEYFSATCTQDGGERMYCPGCGKVYSESIYELAGHLIVTDERIEPTCTEAGRTERVWCDRCGEVLDEGTPIPIDEDAHIFPESGPQEWGANATHHWIAPTCGHDVKQDYKEHSFSFSDPDCWHCGYEDDTLLTFGELSNGEYYVESIGAETGAEIVIPSTYKGKPVSVIGWRVFENCTNITSVTIPDSVTSIWEKAFLGCSNLTELILPDSLTEIGYNAFEGCSSLTSIIIPEGVTEIEGGTFKGCTNLNSVTLPNGITEIENSAFKDCEKLTSVTLPDELTALGGEVFYGCAITSITLPSKVNTFYSTTLHGLDLEEIVVDDENATYYSAGNCIIEDATDTVLFGCKNSVIPDDGSVTAIADYAFQGCEGLTSINLPDSISSIGSYAFAYSGLTSITFPDGISSTGFYAFAGCENLTNVTLSDGISTIDYGTFRGCVSLQSITIPSSVLTLNDSAFANCTSLTDVVFHNDTTTYSYDAFENCAAELNIRYDVKFIEYNNGYYTNSAYGYIFKGVIDKTADFVIVREGTTIMDENALQGCDNLRFVYIPESCQEIAENALHCNSPITFTVFTEGSNENLPIGKVQGVVDEMGTVGTAFHLVVAKARMSEDGFIYQLNSGEIDIWGYAGSEKNVVIPRIIAGYSVSKVLGFAFANTQIDSVTFPAHILEIGGSVVKNLPVYDESGTTVLGETTVYTSALFKGSTVNEIIFAAPSTSLNMTTIYPLAFAEAEYLEKVIFAENVQTLVSPNAFKDCPALEEVTLSTAALFSPNAFSGTTRLNKLVFVESEGYTAANACDITMTEQGLYQVTNRTAIEAATVASPTALAAFVMNNQNKWFEFGMEIPENQ